METNSRITKMGTIQNAATVGHMTVWTRYVYDFLMLGWAVLQRRRNSAKLRTSLLALSDRELLDVGIAREEIGHVALNFAIDPRAGSPEKPTKI
jgi:uncharacterized protein YjiS (DUF1127 family)